MYTTPALWLPSTTVHHTNGRQELFDRALEWFDEATAPDLGPGVAAAYRLRIFDPELWARNCEPYEKPLEAEGPKA